MAFENSPRFDGTRFVSRPSLRRWLCQHRRLVWALIVVALLLDALLVVRSAPAGLFSAAPGGLDGCLVASPAGRPVPAVVRVGKVTRSAGPDGCFFFPELPAGAQELTVELASGGTVTRTVDIVSGQAVGLGEIQVR